MKDLHLIVVGKLNDKNISELENDYFKRLTNPKLTIHEVRAHSEDLAREAREVEIKLDELEAHWANECDQVNLTCSSCQIVSKRDGTLKHNCVEHLLKEQAH